MLKILKCFQGICKQGVLAQSSIKTKKYGRYESKYKNWSFDRKLIHVFSFCLSLAEWVNIYLPSS
jgi:hypothetical protein